MNRNNMNPMPTLEQHNQQRRMQRMAEEMTKPGVGVACSTCGTELIDAHPGALTASLPPKVTVRCPKCGFVGYME